jgi:hypothetical protein
VHIFSPAVVNEVRVSFSRDYSKLAGVHSGADVVNQFGLQGSICRTKPDWREFEYHVRELFADVRVSVVFLAGRNLVLR